MPRMTITALADRIRTEADAYEYLESLRWRTGEPRCPHCRNVGAKFIPSTTGTARKTRTGKLSERPSGATTNQVEGFFSQLKRSIDGTHHHVTGKHLARYLAEYDYRYTLRRVDDTARMALLVGATPLRRLTYAQVKA